MQVSEFIARALRLIRVIDPNQPIKPRDMETAMSALNSMMALWESYPLALGWSDVSNPSDDVPLEPNAIEPAIYNLAVRLSSEYGQAIDAVIARYAEEGLAVLRRQYAASNPLALEIDVPCGNARHGFIRWWNY